MNLGCLVTGAPVPPAPSVARRFVGLGARMPAVGRGLVVDESVPRRRLEFGTSLVGAFEVGVAADVQRVVGAEDVRLGARRPRFLLARSETAERLEALLLVGVKAVVSEADRFHRWRRRRHIGEKFVQTT